MKIIFKVITMEMDLKHAKSEIQRLQSEREKFEQVSFFDNCFRILMRNLERDWK